MKRSVAFRAVVVTSGLLISGMVSCSANLVFATPNTEPPISPNQSRNSQPGGSQSGTISHSGQYEYSKTDSLTSGVYDTTVAGKNTILVSGGTVNFRDATITKSGNSSGDEADFYGTNAAVLSIEASKIKMTNGTVTTDGQHANAVFAYGDSTIDISGTKIKTTSNNSGGVMVAGGGTINATNLEIETYGASSAPIRSDRGGGTMTISGGQYTSSGAGSPAIYSTADVKVKDNAVLKSNASEGIVIEGANSVSLEDGVSLVANNTVLHGNSETFKSIFIYQSMSGDANVGTGNFSIKNSTVNTLNGDTFFVTNTTADINIENTIFSYGDNSNLNGQAFLRAQAGKWGTAGKNGGNVIMNVKNSPILGDIILDNFSTLTVSLNKRTSFMGTINPYRVAKEISVTLDAGSRIILTGDSYISSLVNGVTDNSNIYANGHKLYVAGTEVSINQGEYEEWKYDFSKSEVVTNNTEVTDKTDDKNDLMYWLIGVGGVTTILLVIVVGVILKKQKKAKRINEESAMLIQAENNNMKKPWDIQ